MLEGGSDAEKKKGWNKKMQEVVHGQKIIKKYSPGNSGKGDPHVRGNLC